MKKTLLFFILLISVAACKSAAPIETMGSGFARINIKSITASLTGVHFDGVTGSTTLTMPLDGDSLVSIFDTSKGDTVQYLGGSYTGNGYGLLVDTLNHLLSGYFDSAHNPAEAPNEGDSYEDKFQCRNVRYAVLNDSTFVVNDSPTLSTVTAALSSYYTVTVHGPHDYTWSGSQYNGLVGFDGGAKLTMLITIAK